MCETPRFTTEKTTIATTTTTMASFVEQCTGNLHELLTVG
jgi:hypothetical protein